MNTKGQTGAKLLARLLARRSRVLRAGLIAVNFAVCLALYIITGNAAYAFCDLYRLK